MYQFSALLHRLFVFRIIFVSYHKYGGKIYEFVNT